MPRVRNRLTISLNELLRPQANSARTQKVFPAGLHALTPYDLRTYVSGARGNISAYNGLQMTHRKRLSELSSLCLQ